MLLFTTDSFKHKWACVHWSFSSACLLLSGGSLLNIFTVINVIHLFQELKPKMIFLMKKELKRFKRLLSPDYPACSEREQDDDDKGQDRIRQGILKMALHVLGEMNQTNLANTLQTSKNSIMWLFHYIKTLYLKITWEIKINIWVKGCKLYTVFYVLSVI